MKREAKAPKSRTEQIRGLRMIGFVSTQSHIRLGFHHQHTRKLTCSFLVSFSFVYYCNQAKLCPNDSMCIARQQTPCACPSCTTIACAPCRCLGATGTLVGSHVSSCGETQLAQANRPEMILWLLYFGFTVVCYGPKR